MRKWRPAHKCIYVIPEVKGSYDSLTKIFNSILPLRFSKGQEDMVILLGNYINHGPNSNKVIQLLIDHKLEYGDQFITLMGYNEKLLIEALSSYYSYERWLEVGGKATLNSYSKLTNNDLPPFSRIKDIIPNSHIDFIKSLPSHIDLEDYILFHSGIDLENPENTTDDQYIKDRTSSSNVKLLLSQNKKPLVDNNKVMVGAFNYNSKVPFIYQKYIMLGGSAPTKLVLFELNSFKCEMISDNKSKMYKYKLNIINH